MVPDEQLIWIVPRCGDFSIRAVCRTTRGNVTDLTLAVGSGRSQIAEDKSGEVGFWIHVAVSDQIYKHGTARRVMFSSTA